MADSYFLQYKMQIMLKHLLIRVKERIAFQMRYNRPVYFFVLT